MEAANAHRSRITTDAMREALLASRVVERVNHGVRQAEMNAATAFSAGQELFAVARLDGKVLLFDRQNGDLIRTLKLSDKTFIRDLAFSPPILGSSGRHRLSLPTRFFGRRIRWLRQDLGCKEWG